MTHTWTDRLSEYLDGELSPAEGAALEAHLAGCAPCAAVLAELREVVRHASLMPELQPPRDLWPDLAERLVAPAAVSPAGSVAGAADGSPRLAVSSGGAPLAPLATRRATRRRAYAFTVPQLAAAAVALMLLSGTAVWQLSGGGATAPTGSLADAGTQTPAADPGAGSVADPATTAAAGQAPVDRVILTGAGIEARYADAIGELEAALGDAHAYLDPQTIVALEQSLLAVESALADARAALDADPGSAFLARHLENTTLRKLELLRTASRITART